MRAFRKKQLPGLNYKVIIIAKKCLLTRTTMGLSLSFEYNIHREVQHRFLASKALDSSGRQVGQGGIRVTLNVFKGDCAACTQLASSSGRSSHRCTPSSCVDRLYVNTTRASCFLSVFPGCLPTQEGVGDQSIHQTPGTQGLVMPHCIIRNERYVLSAYLNTAINRECT